MTSPKPYWAEMTTADFSAADTSRWIAVLPVAAVEQHGPHLPVLTDTAIGQAYIDAVLPRLGGLPATVLPIQAIGKSNEHIASPGTLTLSWETLTRVLVETGESVARAGVRKLVLVNSHGGNVPILDVVARELRVSHGMLCVATHWSRLGKPAGLYTAWEDKFGIHGGDVETSIMLAARPDLVNMDKAERFHSAQERFEQEFKHLRAHGIAQFGWMAQDLGPHGTVGDASIATAEKGRATIEHIAERFVELLADVHRFDLARLYQGGEGDDA
jgi:creatinine amidohydrolase